MLQSWNSKTASLSLQIPASTRTKPRNTWTGRWERPCDRVEPAFLRGFDIGGLALSMLGPSAVAPPWTTRHIARS